MIYNCSRVIEGIIHKNTEYEKESEILLASKFFCDHINNIHAILGANITELQAYFEQLCCTDELVTTLCQGFPFWHSNLTLTLHCVHPPQERILDAYDVYTYILMSIFIPLGLLANLVILYAIMRYKCLPTQTGLFLCSLAAGDLGVIIQFIALFIYHKDDADVPTRIHQFLFPSLEIFFACVSLLQIAMISIERALAVTWPFKYQSVISPKRSKYFVEIIWILSFAMMIASLMRIKISSQLYFDVVFYVLFVVFLIIPIAVVVIAYAFVVVSAHQNLRQDRKRLKMLSELLKKEKKAESETTGKKKLCWKLNTVRYKEVKLAANVALIVLPFSICWGFFMFSHMYESLTNHKFSGIFNWFLFVLPFAVSSLNPVLYLVLTRSLRKTVSVMVCRNVKSKLSRTEMSVVTMSAYHNGGQRISTSVSRKKPDVVVSAIESDEDCNESSDFYLLMSKKIDEDTSTNPEQYI